MEICTLTNSMIKIIDSYIAPGKIHLTDTIAAMLARRESFRPSPSQRKSLKQAVACRSESTVLARRRAAMQ